MAQLITTTAVSSPTPTLPLRRRYDNAQAIQRALVDITAALNTGGFAYQGQRQPIYPFKRLVTTLISLPAPADAGQGAEAFITDSQVPYTAANLGTVAQGGGTYFTHIYSDGMNWLVG
jgi:hypothetical protein